MNAPPFEIRCPQCGGLARFHEPYLLQSAGGFPPDESRPQHAWGGWRVIEQFPNLMPWREPPSDGLLRARHRGVVVCETCAIPRTHVLNDDWSLEAWWQWSIRGRRLYADDRAQALALLDFIQATHRPSRGSNGWLASIPSYFLTAKVRDEVVKKISDSLQMG